MTDTINVHGTMRFMNTTDIGDFVAGRAFFPSVPSNGDKEFPATSGDIKINQTSSDIFNFSEHGFGNSVLLHEIGHALGLGHPNSVSATFPLINSLGTIP